MSDPIDLADATWTSVLPGPWVSMVVLPEVTPPASDLTWAYEAPGYYHLYGDGPFDGPDCFLALTLDVPRTPETDADVAVILAALQRIAQRHQPPSHECQR